MAIQVVAQSADHSYVFETKKHSWDDVTDHTLGRQYTHPGFSCVLDKRDLKPGQLCIVATVNERPGSAVSEDRGGGGDLGSIGKLAMFLVR